MLLWNSTLTIIKEIFKVALKDGQYLFVIRNLKVSFLVVNSFSAWLQWEIKMTIGDNSQISAAPLGH